MPVFRLSNAIQFPPPELADDGLVAVGGDLSLPRLLAAYRAGIFPWYSDDEPILWWSPDPRMVLLPDWLHVSRRLDRTLRQNRFEIRLDSAFGEVIRGCAGAPRKRQRGTWITPDMIAAYQRLHDAGYAHSIEAWHKGELAGGLYGVCLGACFFGESMFSRRPDASKAAFATLVRHAASLGISLFDCQVANPHLRRLGARELPRHAFLGLLHRCLQADRRPGPWRDLRLHG